MDIIKVRFKNKIAEPLMNATDFRLQAREQSDNTYLYSLVFKVCYSDGVFKSYRFDSCDEALLQTLLERITAKGEFVFDTACKVCEQTSQGAALNYDSYLALSQSGELEGELKFVGGDYVITA